MPKKVPKTIEFANEDDYLELKAEATRNKQNVGDFIIMLFKHWKETQKKGE